MSIFLSAYTICLFRYVYISRLLDSIIFSLFLFCLLNNKTTLCFKCQHSKVLSRGSSALKVEIRSNLVKSGLEDYIV